MNVRELWYLAELVKRDGDAYLQAYHGINRQSLYGALRDIAGIAERGKFGATHFAVYRDAEIGEDPTKPTPGGER